MKTAPSVSFPPGFLWGVATSAYQVEGASGPAERGEVAWDSFLADGKRLRGDTGTTAADHIRHLDLDLDLLGHLGVGAYRLSISWARVMHDGRTPAAQGLDFYDRLVDGLLDRGITPMATLYHMDLPASIGRGGWAERDTAELFADYAAHVVGRLSDRVTLWATVNEPYAESWLGHHDGAWPPGETSAARAVASLHHKLLGHGLAVQAARTASRRTIQLGLVNSYEPCLAASHREEDVHAAFLLDAHSNRFVLDPLLLGSYPDEVVAYHEPRGLDAVRDGDLDIIATATDFLGVNYYARRHVASLATGSATHLTPHRDVRDGYQLRYMTDLGVADVVPPGLPRSAIGRPVEPAGLTEALTQITARYGRIALYITENGICLNDYVNPDKHVNDDPRIEFLENHIAAAAKAIESGVDLRGYFVWSLLDNLEWHLGYGPRFGLVYVDFATQTRYPKKSYAWFREFLSDAKGPSN